MTSFFLGIDPGASGAWAITDKHGHIELGKYECFKCFRDSVGPNNLVDVFAVLELVHAFPKQGVSSVFSFGENYGGWKATLELLGIPYVLVPPRNWQKAILGSFPTGESKQRALEYAQKRWPQFNLKKKDHGLIDALCIALYAKQIGET